MRQQGLEVLFSCYDIGKMITLLIEYSVHLERDTM